MNFIHIFPSNCNIKYKLKATQFLENIAVRSHRLSAVTVGAQP